MQTFPVLDCGCGTGLASEAGEPTGLASWPARLARVISWRCCEKSTVQGVYKSNGKRVARRKRETFIENRPMDLAGGFEC